MIIAIEGGDKAGKETQSKLLEQVLKAKRIKTSRFSFPDYTTTIGKEIRLYLQEKQDFPPQVIHCLLSANRWEKFQAIKSALAKKHVIIMDRYYPSNLVYGKINGLKSDWLENLDKGLPKANLVILLDVSQKISFSRQKINRDKFEKDTKFSHKVSRTYKTIAKEKKWKIIDASRPRQDIHNDIMKICKKRLKI